MLLEEFVFVVDSFPVNELAKALAFVDHVLNKLLSIFITCFELVKLQILSDVLSSRLGLNDKTSFFLLEIGGLHTLENAHYYSLMNIICQSLYPHYMDSS